jgi:hypothetical protein
MVETLSDKNATLNTGTGRSISSDLSSNSSLKTYAELIGEVVINQLSLEHVLRIFLATANKEEIKLFSQITLPCKETYYTNYDQLEALLKKYVGSLTKDECKFAINKKGRDSIIKVRHALAHGRLWSDEASGHPLRLVKPNRPSEGKIISFDFDETLTEDFLSKHINVISATISKIFDCGKKRGYSCFHKN